MKKEDIQKQIESVSNRLNGISSTYYYECLERTEKMYPPDGGGHGYKWRALIRDQDRERKALRIQLDDLEKQLGQLETEAEEDTISQKEEMFVNKNNNQEIAPLVIDINEELKRYLSRHPEKLHDLSPRKFEELIADILCDFGFDVELTPATRDGGKDIYAYIKSQVCSFLMFVECKKWSPDHHIGIEVVQRLYGVQQVNKANKSMVVTTSFFTKPAIEESKRYEALMTLCDYNDLKEWLKRYE